MLSLVGDDEIDVIKLPKGMKIHIDYTIGESKEYSLVGAVESAVNIDVLDYMTKMIIYLVSLLKKIHYMNLIEG